MIDTKRPQGQQAPDENRPTNLRKDPRGDNPSKYIHAKRTAGRNTESFDPQSTLVRPDVRIKVSLPSKKKFSGPLRHDDVVIVPELFGDEDDWSLYYQLVEEMTELQAQNVRGSDWIAWHEGAHLIVKNPKGSKTFNDVIDKLCEYFNIRKTSVGTRFNWYKDGHDWKPFHHDSAAFNPDRAKNQNITVGVSFGSTRELAFLRAGQDDSKRSKGGGNNSNSNNNNNGNSNGSDACRLYFPQPNNGVFTFGRDVNIRWKHGINALPPDQRSEKGRVSIILWGLALDAIEEDGSPQLLGSDGKGPHASKGLPKRRNQRGRGAGRGGSDRGGRGHSRNDRSGRRRSVKNKEERDGGNKKPAVREA